MKNHVSFLAQAVRLIAHRHRYGRHPVCPNCGSPFTRLDHDTDLGHGVSHRLYYCETCRGGWFSRPFKRPPQVETGGELITN